MPESAEGWHSPAARAPDSQRDVPLERLTAFERLNFLLTNRIPRRTLTLLLGRFSKVESPLVRWLSIGLWKLFVDDLRLFEAERQSFASLHDCFVRKLKPGARPVDPKPEIVVSPCDAVIGELGNIRGREVIQAKGFPYLVTDLLGDERLAAGYEDGVFVTLRLKSSMYHRFHAPCDGRLDAVTYISGDTWNVNPVALRCIERLFCKNERVVIPLRDSKQPDSGFPAITIVAVAAVLVASVRLHGLEAALDLRYRGPNRLPCPRFLAKGQEIGYFEHGSTIVLIATGRFRFIDDVETGRIIRMGEPLLRSD